MTGRGVSIDVGNVARDRADVIGLIERNLPPVGGAEARFAHYYESSPLGPPAFWLARDDATGRAVGLLAVLPTLARLDGRLVRSGVQCDFVVDADRRGPLGPAVPLVRSMTSWLDESELLFSYGRPLPTSHRILTSLSNEILGPATALGRPMRVGRLLAQSGRVPTSMAPLARPLDLLLRARFRDDRGRLGTRGLEVGRRPHFDQDFEDLWAEAAGRFRLIGERSVGYLNWRYGLDDTGAAARRHDLITVVDATGRVAGYAAALESVDRLYVHDILARPDRPVVDALVGELVRHGRRRGVSSISLILFGGDDVLGARLRSFGFAGRSHGGSFTVRWSPSTTVARPRAPDGWYLVRGDEDF